MQQPRGSTPSILVALGALAPLSVVPSSSVLSPFVWVSVVVGLAIVVPSLVRRQPRQPHLAEWIAFAWIAALWLSAVLSEDRSIGSMAALRFTAMALVLLAARVSVRDHDAARRLLIAIAIGSLIGAAAALFILALGGTLGFGDHFFGLTTRLGPWDRLTRPWSHANVAAMALGSTITTVAAFRQRWVAVAAASVLAIALVLTYSRGGLAAGVAAGVVWALIRRRDARSVGLVLLVAIATVAIAPGWTARFRQPDNRAWYGVDITAPDELTVGPDGGFADIELTNTSLLKRSPTDDDPVLISARWFDAGGRIAGEHWWVLPDEFGPGDTIAAPLTIDPQVPDGTYEVWWDLRLDQEAYFRQFLGDEQVASTVVVRDSGIDPDGVERYDLVTPRPRLGRRDLWRAAVDAFTSAPLLGVGPGQVDPQRDVEEAARIFPGGHAHSIVLEPLATWGLLGFLPFAALVIGAGYRALRHALHTRAVVPAVVLANLVAIAVHGLVDWPIIFLSVTIPLAIMSGIAWSPLFDRATPSADSG